jgi:UDPglucose 6-dehydrogenase
VQAYDPVAQPQPTDVPPEVTLARDEYEAVTDADAVVFVTEWNQFLALDMNRIKGLMRSPRIADLRNIYEPDEMKKLGFEYVGVGRQPKPERLSQAN